MAKETQKEKILRLQSENEEIKKMLQHADKEIQELKKENLKMKEEKKHKVISNLDIIDQQLQSARRSSDRWHDEFYKKNEECKKLKSEIQELKNETQKVESKNKKNERGAGRKKVISEQERTEMKRYRMQGKTIKEIAEMFNRSVGIVHKIINEK